MPGDSRSGQLDVVVGWEGNVMTFALTGSLTLDTFVQSLLPVIDLEGYAFSPRLWDVRDVEVPASSAELFVMGQLADEADHDRPSVAAFVANPGVQFMKFETYQAARADPKHMRRVFATRPEALEWLNAQMPVHPEGARQRSGVAAPADKAGTPTPDKPG